MNKNTNHRTNDLESPDRFAYLLHLWCNTEQWRASLEYLETGKRIGFANLEQIFAYLMDLIEGNLNKQPNAEKERKEETGKRN